MPDMKAIRMHAFGDSSVLALDTIAAPELKDDQVLVRVRGASVNPVDYKTRSGTFPIVRQDQLPIVLGRDISGTVLHCGRSVRHLQEGDEVFALLEPHTGSYCEQVAVRADLCAKKPERLSHVEAAGVPLAALTAWQGLFDQGHLRSGQKVLIHGGGGGVGHFAIQFAKSRGAHVVTTVSKPDLEFAAELGADRAIDYNKERFEQVVSSADMVFDLVDGETQLRSLDVLKPGGVLISTLGTPSESQARARDVRIGSYVTQPNAEELGEIARLIDAGQVSPHLQATYPLDQAAQAQDDLEQHHVQGKLVLKVA